MKITLFVYQQSILNSLPEIDLMLAKASVGTRKKKYRSRKQTTDKKIFKHPYKNYISTPTALAGSSLWLGGPP